MKGNIYSRQKCFVCGATLVHNERRHGCFCPEHPQVAATRFYVRFEKVFKNFKSYPEAAQFISGLRFKTVEGTFDARDYQKDAPMGFETQAKEFIRSKEQLKVKSINNIKNYMNRAMAVFGQKNVKTFNRKDIRLFLYGIQGISEKTRHNHRSCLHDFFKSLVDDDVISIIQMPKFPDVPYELGYRKITDLETQGKIIEQVKALSFHINPKIWLGIELLSSYPTLRPGDLLKLTEADIDLEYGILTIYRPTKSRGKLQVKTVRLIENHIWLIADIQSKKPGLPHMPFFRHVSGIKGIQAEAPFGQKYFKKWWDKACQNLGVQGLDLYGGTRHTTTTALARAVGRDGARKASEHKTNKAFDRYCQIQDDSAFEMAKITAELKGKGAKVIKLDKKKSQ